MIEKIWICLKKKTGSAKENCFGFYITKDIWEDKGFIKDEKGWSSGGISIIQPLYDIGTIGSDAAEKYAEWSYETHNKPAYIYQIDLAPDINLIGNNNACVDKETFDKAINSGYDGYFTKNEGVILNKEKILSIKPIFYAEHEMYAVGEIYRGKIDNSKIKIVPHNQIKNYINKIGDGNYKLVKDNYVGFGHKGWIYHNDNGNPVMVWKSFPLDWKKVKNK